MIVVIIYFPASNFHFSNFQGSEWESQWAGSGRGDEVCQILNTQLELTDTIDVFPEGLSLGYFYNYCQEEEWKDTGARSEVRLCCQGGKARDCQEILEEAESQEEDQAADLTMSGGATILKYCISSILKWQNVNFRVRY